MAIKTKYRIKNSDGLYDTMHFETSAEQIITNDKLQFVTNDEKANWDAKANNIHEHTLDSIKDIASKNICMGQEYISNFDFNTMLYSGIYPCDITNATNKPVSYKHGNLIIFASNIESKSYVTQIYFPFSNDNPVFYRTMIDKEWTNWRPFGSLMI